MHLSMYESVRRRAAGSGFEYSREQQQGKGRFVNKLILNTLHVEDLLLARASISNVSLKRGGKVCSE